MLPEELIPGWDRQPLGDQMFTDVASLLESENWQCEYDFYPHGLSAHGIY